jgi:hypothetical protein
MLVFVLVGLHSLKATRTIVQDLSWINKRRFLSEDSSTRSVSFNEEHYLPSERT